MMYDRFKEKGVNNVLWVWTAEGIDPNNPEAGDDSDWYPGDEYVDIIGTDCYHFGGAEGTEDYLRRAHRQLDAASQLAKKHHKRLAFTETGCESIRCPHWYTEVLLPLLREYPTIEYVLVWRNAWDIPQHFFIPNPQHPEAPAFIQFLHEL